jgi:hypothetical protein
MMTKNLYQKFTLLLMTLLVSSIAHAALPDGSGTQSFTASGSFAVPAGVRSVRVVLIGGGGAGAGSHYRAGGSGYLVSEIVSVSPGENISIIVGAAGASAGCAGNSCDGGDGGDSMFGDELVSAGGVGGSSDGGSGDGGTGAGGAGNDGFGGAGGTGGSNGAPGDDYDGGIGQGTGVWSDILSSISYSSFSAGDGGSPSIGSHQGGGGAGGLLANGSGPSAGNGGTNGSLVGAEGGTGYGAGGGSGGYNSGDGYAVGGDGAAGFVYIEWGSDIGADSGVLEPVPSMSSYGLVLLIFSLLLMAAVYQRSLFRKD